MSFGGGGQGSVRYAVLVTDQATAPLQNINRQFTTFGQQMTNSVTKVNAFNSAINNNSKTFTASATAIKTQGNALAGLQTNLAANTTQATGLGTSIKNTASKFAGFATGLSATTAGALQLAAGFRDYNDATIAVERQTRKLSLANEAVAKAQDKLKKLTDAGVTSGKEYEQAQLDVSQAQQNLSVQTQLLGEKQEALFDSQTQFVTAVIPTTLGAIGTLGSAFKDLGGEGGIGGLATKFKDFGGGIKTSVTSAITGLMGSSGLGGLTEKFKSVGTAAGGLKSNLLGLGVTAGAIGLVTIAALALADGINKVAKQWSSIKEPVSALEASLDKSGKSLDTFNLSLAETEVAMKAGVSPAMVAMDSILGTKLSKTILTNTGLLDENGKQTQLWKDQVAAATQELIKQGKIVPQTGKAISDLGASFTATSADYVEWSANMLKSGKTAGQVFDFLKRAKIDDTHITEIQIRAYDEITKAQEAVLQPANEWIQGLKDQKKKTEDTIVSLHEYAKAHGIEIPASIQNDIKAMQDLIATHEHLTTTMKVTGTGAANLTGETEKYHLAVGVSINTTERLRQQFLDTTGAQSLFALSTHKVIDGFHGEVAVIQGFGDTLDNLAKRFGAVNAKIKEIKFPTSPDVSKMSGPFGGNLAAKDTTQQYKDLDLVMNKHIEILKTEHSNLLNQAIAYGASSTQLKGLTVTSIQGNDAIAKQNQALKALILSLAAVPPQYDEIANATYQGNLATLQFVKSTQLAAVQEKAHHDSLMDLVGAQIKLRPTIDLTTSELESLQTALAKSKVDAAGMSEATKILSDAFNKELTPSLQTFNSAITADKFKDFKNALKDLPGFGDFTKGAKKEFTDLIGDMRKVAKKAKEVGTDISAAILGAFEGVSGKSLGSVIKNLVKDVNEISKIDIDATKFKPITDFLEGLSKGDRAEGILKIKDSLALMQDAMADGVVTSDEAASVLAKFNEETGKTGTTVGTTTDKFGKFAEEATKVKVTAQVAKFVSDAWGLASASMATSVDLATKFITKALGGIATQAVTATITVDTKPAQAAITGVIKRIDSISNMKPAPQLNTKPANSALSALIKRIDSIDNMKPAPKLNTKPANSSLSALIKRIDSIDNMKPAPKLNTGPANKSLSALINRIDSISNMHPTVHVKVVQDKIAAQHGFHGKLSGDTTIQAHAGEQVDIWPRGESERERGGRTMSSRSSGAVAGGGDTNVYINVMDETIMHKIQARQGRQRYTFGA